MSSMQTVKFINGVLAFSLELTMLVAMGYWAYQQGKSGFLKILFAIALPALAIVLWGLFAAPKANYRIAFPARIFFELTLFLLGAFLLYLTGHKNLAIVFAVLAILCETLAYVFNE
jgi:Protein of unknown function (DUF2568)